MSKLTIIGDYTVGDTLPLFKANWGAGEVDITGWVITARLRRTDATLLSKVAVVTSGAAGDFEFRWISTDLQAGYQPTEIHFLDTAGGSFVIGSMVFDVRSNV